MSSNVQFFQKTIKIPAKSRGFHIITNNITKGFPEIQKIQMGMLNVFLMHTSASLTINENCCSEVREDMKNHFRRTIPDHNEGVKYLHSYEGNDDQSAHIKSSELGVSLTIPIHNGSLGLGTWQGIYLGEHRSSSGGRKVMCTAYGQTFQEKNKKK
ncbi:secondary thiaminee-phosphate synthase enzyme yjbq [Anaeramoeba flamelloides]|uniref:Secondary thiaminee-phosphate synthase enzyme yjbq n=1 Tax=Anaeramoeba flamelloides TaxID=1746091 RepID=A0AAV7YGP0_9EUKA|nr:secondary thiaminee-phosphate synthase enzyme yjbq [Anaeramoeba flamelloides]KAJ6242691.1 secondary thiaminee-phosphate synthase enzyme yjbq [Anaeramoeba flamelloides]|eukprot:Anaeramoba_flamelloidesa1084977_50.p1 GENE.a1084977_50~~a1084977_50.p1  ORF type:complete len:156 (-),score=27.24 a1084977_50:5-472(-)